jgi:hypothetical protein
MHKRSNWQKGENSFLLLSQDNNNKPIKLLAKKE